MKMAFTDLLHRQLQSQITGFWLETSVDNLSAIHLYQKFGFKKRSVSENKIIMTLSRNKVNL